MKRNARQQSRLMLMEALYAWSVAKTPKLEAALEARTRAEQAGLVFDAPYFQELFHYVTNHTEALNEMIMRYAKRDHDTIHPVEQAILWVAAAELKERLDVPYKVVINEALNLSKTYGSHESHRFVNGVLDPLSKELRPERQGGGA